MIDLVNTAPYLLVMKTTPAWGTMWVWTVVKLKLGGAVAALVGVVGISVVRGQAGSLVGY